MSNRSWIIVPDFLRKQSEASGSSAVSAAFCRRSVTTRRAWGLLSCHSMTSTHGAGKNALDEFLSESVFTTHTRGPLRGEIELYVAPEDVRLDSIDAIAQSTTAAKSTVQIWPMLAAALVAIGVSILAMAAFARFGISPL